MCDIVHDRCCASSTKLLAMGKKSAFITEIRKFSVNYSSTFNSNLSLDARWVQNSNFPASVRNKIRALVRVHKCIDDFKTSMFFAYINSVIL